MSLKSAGLAAKSVGYITWAIDGAIRIVSRVGKKGYEIVINKPKYSVEIMIGETLIEDNIDFKQVNELLKAMNTIDSVSIIVRKYKYEA